MTAPRDPAVLFGDMLDAIGQIENWAGEGEGAFTADRKTQLAVERCFEILGEAANRLPETVRQRFPAIPWRVIIDHRNRLIHGYFLVDPQRVWATVVQDLPRLKLQLQQALTELQTP